MRDEVIRTTYLSSRVKPHPSFYQRIEEQERGSMSCIAVCIRSCDILFVYIYILRTQYGNKTVTVKSRHENETRYLYRLDMGMRLVTCTDLTWE